MPWCRIIGHSAPCSYLSHCATDRCCCAPAAFSRSCSCCGDHCTPNSPRMNCSTCMWPLPAAAAAAALASQAQLCSSSQRRVSISPHLALSVHTRASSQGQPRDSPGTASSCTWEPCQHQQHCVVCPRLSQQCCYAAAPTAGGDRCLSGLRLQLRSLRASGSLLCADTAVCAVVHRVLQLCRLPH
jgi:hypothetical protein